MNKLDGIVAAAGKRTEREAALERALRMMLNRYPAFRSKPVGSSGSMARFEQEADVAMEDLAREALAMPVGRQS